MLFVLLSAWQNFWRNFSLSLSVVSVLSVTLFSSVVLVFVSLITDTAVNMIHDKVDLNIEIQDSAPLAEVDAVLALLQKEPSVKTARFVSREESFEKFREKYPQISQFLIEYRLENPFRSRLQVVTKSPDDHMDILYFLSPEKYRGLFDLDLAKKSLLHKSRTERLLTLTHGVQKAALFAQLFFTLVAFFIIFHTIRILLFYRRAELDLMSLVGASRWYLFGPFYAEAVLYGFFASLLSLCFLWPVVHFFSPIFSRYFDVSWFFFTRSPFDILFPKMSQNIADFFSTQLVLFFLFSFII